MTIGKTPDDELQQMVSGCKCLIYNEQETPGTSGIETNKCQMYAKCNFCGLLIVILV